jgi:hypothetical protein
MKIVMIIAAMFALTGCASVHTEEYVDRDIRQVILDNGPPINAIDMGDGTRTFQFKFGGGSIVAPQVTATGAPITKSDSDAWFQSAPITTSGGQRVVNDDCVSSYLTKWDGEVWRVLSYRIPKQRVC